MRDIGIIFHGWGVRAILDGRKTVTRRTRGLTVVNNVFQDIQGQWHFSNGFWMLTQDGTHGPLPFVVKCPYGDKGDRLWVRETWMPETEQRIPTGGIIYQATCKPEGDVSRLTWRPSIHMPRWASRITLEITDVRPERLQEITVMDVAREGALRSGPIKGDEFQNLWDSINGKKYPWDSNPWVWRIGFRRVR